MAHLLQVRKATVRCDLRKLASQELLQWLNGGVAELARRDLRPIVAGDGDP
jgi:DeoR/GlpR family transcriptional regulator of sugar metabolism